MPAKYPKLKTFIANLIQNYTKIYQSGFNNRRLAYDKFKTQLESLKEQKRLQVEKVGKSIEGRDIYKVEIGQGPIKVLLWSQMHGNESTATRALLDIFNFFSIDGIWEEEQDSLSEKLHLTFIPMLNPDGSDKYIRENALGVDMNRDAKVLLSPESQLLNKLVTDLRPEFAFNLHDQVKYYTVGTSRLPAGVSLLAPPVDFENSIPPQRKSAMQVVAVINDILQEYLPGRIGRYLDEHDPRAFGDTIQQAGSATILIESGEVKNDEEREKIRQMNVIAIIGALKSIAERSYEKMPTDKYVSIPENTKSMMDTIIRGGKILFENKDWQVDIGIMLEEIYDGQRFYYRGLIEAIGDLSTFSGYHEINADGCYIEPGNIYQANSLEDIKYKLESLINEKYTGVKIKEQFTPGVSPVDLNIYLNGEYKNELKPGCGANLVVTRNNEIELIMINGFFGKPSSGIGFVKNALIV